MPHCPAKHAIRKKKRVSFAEYRLDVWLVMHENTCVQPISQIIKQPDLADNAKPVIQPILGDLQKLITHSFGPYLGHIAQPPALDAIKIIVTKAQQGIVLIAIAMITKEPNIVCQTLVINV